MADPAPEGGLLDSLEFGPIETGVPLPPLGGRMPELRELCTGLDVGHSFRVGHATRRAENMLRAKVRDIGLAVGMTFSVRGETHRRKGEHGTRNVRVYRTS